MSADTTARRQRKWSLRLRITVLATVVVALAVGATGGAIVWVVRDSLEGRARDDIDRSLGLAALQLQRGDIDLSKEKLDVTRKMGVEVRDARGNVLFSGEELPAVPAVPLPPAPPGQGGYVRRSGAPDVLLGFRTVTTPNGELTVVAANSLTDVIRGVDSVVRALWYVMPLLLVVVAFLAWVLVGRALRPIEAMRREVEDITHSTLDRRVEHPGRDDEVGKLAQTLNGMLDRLQSAVRRQQEFVSDASHELRSPVASMRVNVEVGLRNPEATDWTQVGQDVLDETLRLDALVDDLLLAARLEEGALADTLLDFDAVVQAECARARAGAPIAVTLVPARVCGDEVQLRRAISNVLDNATRHARSRVQVALSAEADQAVIIVDDDGPGIAEDQRERVFERFARVEEARDRDLGGTGLGLALVRRIMRAHGGDAHASANPEGGARLLLCLPLAAEPQD